MFKFPRVKAFVFSILAFSFSVLTIAESVPKNKWEKIVDAEDVSYNVDFHNLAEAGLLQIYGSYEKANNEKGAFILGFDSDGVLLDEHRYTDKSIERFVSNVNLQEKAYLLVIDASGHSLILDLQKDLSISELEIDLGRFIASSMAQYSQNSLIVFGNRNGRPVTKIVNLHDGSVSQLQNLISTDSALYADSSAFFGNKRYFTTFSGEISQFFQNRGEIVVHQFIDASESDAKLTRNGRSSDFDVNGNSKSALLYDIEEATKQRFVLEQFDASFKPEWTKTVLENDFGLQKFSLASIKNYWLVAGNKSNRMYWVLFDESGEILAEDHNMEGNPVISSRASCNADSCAVVGVGIHLNSEGRKQQKIHISYVAVD